MCKTTLFEIILIALCITLVAIVIALIGFCIYDGVTTTEVETYTVGCEISQLSYAEKTNGRASSKAVYKMGVRNDDFATVFNINADTYAKYVVGDVVEVEVTVWEHYDGHLTYEYKLIG
jgi:hypothetical protein